MPAEKTDAIVLKVVEFMESSLIVTLLTRDFGKISGLAKGARRPKSAFETALDVLSVCRIVFLPRPAGTLELLTEAKLERRFKAGNHGLESLYAGYYVAELLTQLTDEHDAHPELFADADATLTYLETGQDPEWVTVQFEMSLLKRLGHLPLLDHCASCGQARKGTGRVAFGLNDGGVLCQDCKQNKRQLVSLSQEAWHFLFHATKNAGESWKAPEKWPRAEVRKLLNNYLAHLVGHPLRLHSYLGPQARV